MAATKAKKKAKPSRNGKAKKPKQQHLPGMEPPSIPEIDRLADKYKDARDQRMELTKEEVKNADLLEAMMKKHGLQRYEYDGKIVELQHTEKVKVRRKEPAEFVREKAAAREASENGKE